jgi:hypothetical protein
MNLDAILEVAMGLVVMWLTLSVAVSQVQEWISSWLGLRAKMLELSITNMLKNGDLVKAFYNHPLIQTLSQPNKSIMEPLQPAGQVSKRQVQAGQKKPSIIRKPSYIQAADFASVMMDLIMKDANTPDQQVIATSTPTFAQKVNDGISNFRQNYPGIDQIVELHFPHLTNAAIDTAKSATQAQINLENWFNSVQERAKGWYTRRAMIISFVLGLVFAVMFNVDSIQISSQLWKAPTIRQALVAQAGTTVANGAAPTNTLSQLAKLNPQDYADSLAIPLGWSTAPVTDPAVTQCGWTPGQNVHPYIMLNNECNIVVNLPAMNNPGGWIAKFFGILITGLAAAQGSPFWFNLLNRLVNMRDSGGASVKTLSTPTVNQYNQAQTAATAPAQASAPTDGSVG